MGCTSPVDILYGGGKMSVEEFHGKDVSNKHEMSELKQIERTSQTDVDEFMDGLDKFQDGYLSVNLPVIVQALT
jgi:hypothetical protein